MLLNQTYLRKSPCRKALCPSSASLRRQSLRSQQGRKMAGSTGPHAGGAGARGPGEAERQDPVPSVTAHPLHQAAQGEKRWHRAAPTRPSPQSHRVAQARDQTQRGNSNCSPLDFQEETGEMSKMGQGRRTLSSLLWVSTPHTRGQTAIAPGGGNEGLSSNSSNKQKEETQQRHVDGRSSKQGGRPICKVPSGQSQLHRLEPSASEQENPRDNGALPWPPTSLPSQTAPNIPRRTKLPSEDA